MSKISFDNLDDSLFSSNQPKEEVIHEEQYNVLIADDDESVHRISEIILKNFSFEGKSLRVFHAYSGKEAIDVIKNNKIALVFLDVVMEEDDSGLQVVKTIRNDLKQMNIRIILRTGHPGEAPEEEIIRTYDINDYRLKTELTAKRIKTSLFSALRSYRDLEKLSKHKEGLKKIIRASGRLFENNSFEDFLMSILTEISAFQKDRDMMFFREEESSGFVTMEENHKNKVVAATGKFKQYIGKEISQVKELAELNSNFENCLINNKEDVIKTIDNGFLIHNKGKSHLNNCIFIEGNPDNFDFSMIELFMSNFAIALDNHILNNMLQSKQKDILYALGETVESHFEETGHHVKRISHMMARFALLTHESYAESELLKMASSLHDLGKIAIPDSILKKPGKLTKEEFEVIKTHTIHGYKILSNSDLPVLQFAAEIALNHHERYDGTGYPGGRVGLDIPKAARMMAIVDVFDALTHERVYKEASTVAQALEYIYAQKGKHFDPLLVDVFVEHLDDIVKDIE